MHVFVLGRHCWIVPRLHTSGNKVPAWLSCTELMNWGSGALHVTQYEVVCSLKDQYFSFLEFEPRCFSYLSNSLSSETIFTTVLSPCLCRCDSIILFSCDHSTVLACTFSSQSWHVIFPFFVSFRKGFHLLWRNYCLCRSLCCVAVLLILSNSSILAMTTSSFSAEFACHAIFELLWFHFLLAVINMLLFVCVYRTPFNASLSQVVNFGMTFMPRVP